MSSPLDIPPAANSNAPQNTDAGEVQEVTLPAGAKARFATVLTTEALAFVVDMHRRFQPQMAALLEKRHARAEAWREGARLDFLAETADIRDAEWQVTSIPKDLQDRRVEITGPVDRKMMINALNSGAKCFMADLEDSLSPGFEQVMAGQVNLQDAVRRQMEYVSPEGKKYQLNEELATLIVRPRGLHLPEMHIVVDGTPIAGALVDAGLYLFHNAKELVARGSGPYFYLPKLEHYEEAAWWSEVFRYAEERLGLAYQTIKCTVLIETFPAVFQMEEILYALKDYIVGQNAGRWDYIFSYIKTHAHNPHFLCPDRQQITMTQPFMAAYTQLLIHTCHKRGAHAMGGMAPHIPLKRADEATNEKIFAQVRADKEREVKAGHDGTWVAHPGLIPLAKEVFDTHMKGAAQHEKGLEHPGITAEDLKLVPEGDVTEGGVRNNIAVSLRYLTSWLQGNGCVPIFGLMEDAATAEIARTQLWQWVRYGATLQEGSKMEEARYLDLQAEELGRYRDELGEVDANALPVHAAASLLEQLVLAEELEDFLTLRALPQLG